MELLGTFQVRLLHVLLRYVLGNTKNLVIINKCHINVSFLFYWKSSNFRAEVIEKQHFLLLFS